MTPKQFERMAKCDHRKTCERLVTLRASSYADSYHWCLCGECPHYTTENAKLRELVLDYEALTATLCNERDCDGCTFDSEQQLVCEHMRLVACLGELGIEVDK